jgi:hypothetical protein
MRQRVVKALKSLHAISVENPCRPGTPDLNYGGPRSGWIELKWESKWPVRPTTPLRLTSDFSPQQRIFAIKRTMSGGRSHFLLQVGQDWLLLEGETAAKIVGTACRAELEAAAIQRWHGAEMEERILKWCLDP